MSIELVLAAQRIEDMEELLKSCISDNEKLNGLLVRCLPIVEEMASMTDDEETELLAAEIKEVLGNE